MTLFSQQLREATAVRHEQAHDSGFMTALTSGRLDAHAYGTLAGQLWFVYDALERTGEALRSHQVVGGFVDENLHRREALRADLAYLHGAGWESRLHALESTDAYVRRIEATQAWAPAYLAHHYTRYLGDLSGGQIMARVLTRSYGMTDGLAFFAFERIPKPKPYKDAYRARLDALPLDETERQRVVREAQLAFDLNVALFTTLATLHHPRAS